MKLTNIDEIIEEGLEVFMPSGIQATLFKKGKDIIVKYYNLKEDKYTIKEFKNIMKEGIFVFNSIPVGYQSALMESKEEKSLDFLGIKEDDFIGFNDLKNKIEQNTTYKVINHGDHWISIQNDKDEVIELKVTKKLVEQITPNEVQAMDNEIELRNSESEEQEAVATYLKRAKEAKCKGDEELCNLYKELADDEEVHASQIRTILDKFGMSNKENEQEGKIEAEEIMKEFVNENFEASQGQIFKAMKDKKKEYLTADFKNELLKTLERISKEYPNVKVRQQALTLMDEIGLQEYHDTAKVKKFIQKHLEILDQHVNESLNEEKDVLSAEIKQGKKEGKDAELGEWILLTSMDDKWEKLSDNMKLFVLDAISKRVSEDCLTETDLKLVIKGDEGLTKLDIESLNLFSEEEINNLENKELTCLLSFEIKNVKQKSKKEESFKLKRKKKSKKQLDEKTKVNDMEKLTACTFKVYNSIENQECGTFNSWNEVQDFLDKEYGNYATAFKAENPDFIGTCNKDEFLANYEFDIIQQKNPEKAANVEIVNIERTEVINDKNQMTPEEECKEEECCNDDCKDAECKEEDCCKESDDIEDDAAEKEETEEVIEDEKEETAEIKSKEEAEDLLDEVEDNLDSLEDFIKSLTDTVELSEEELEEIKAAEKEKEESEEENITEMCMQKLPENATAKAHAYLKDCVAAGGYKTIEELKAEYSLDDMEQDFGKIEDEEVRKAAQNILDSKNEAFNDGMGMLTDINDLDFPDALKNAVDTKEDGSLYRLADIAKLIQELKSEIDELKADIKLNLGQLKQDIKDDVKDIQYNVTSKLDNTDSKITDLTAEEEDLEEESREEELEESINEEQLKGNKVWEAINQVISNNSHPMGYISVFTISEKLREDYGINTKCSSVYNTVEKLCTETSIKEHIVDTELEKSSLKESLLGKASKWISGGLMTKCAKQKEKEKNEELNKVKAEIDKLHSQNKQDKIKDTISLLADNEQEAQEAEEYALQKVQEDKAKNLKEALLKTSSNSKLNKIKFGE